MQSMLSSVLNLPPLVYVVVALGTILYFKTRRNVPRNIPPFAARPYPIVGHAPLLKDGPSKVFKEWRKSAGDIFSVYIGSELLIIINSYEMVKEAFVKHADVLSDRPSSFLTKHVPHADLGIINSSGANWKEQRSVSLSILRKFGMGKNFLAEKINEEIAFYMQALTDLKGKPTDIQILTNTCISNVICAILIGDRFEYDDPYFTRLIELVNENIVLLGNAPLLKSFPWLKYLPGDPLGARKMVKNVIDVRSHFSDRFIKEFKAEEGGVDNFISSYYQEMEKKIESGVSTNLDDNNLLNVIGNLFVAGTETTSTTLLWSMLFAMHYPEAQEKLYKEIADKIGTERPPSLQDKSHMNYTNAYINETLRLAAIAPLSIPHMCTENLEIAGYTIPKGTTVLANLSEILHDEELWGDPYVFRPERFMEKEGGAAPEEFIPFSVGRRYCMGESLAKMELFLFITGVFQRFEIRAEDPQNLPSLEPRFSAATSPQPFKPRLIERN